MTPQPNEEEQKAWQEYSSTKQYGSTDPYNVFIVGRSSRDAEVAELKKQVQRLEEALKVTGHVAFKAVAEKHAQLQDQLESERTAREKAEACCAEMREALKKAYLENQNIHCSTTISPKIGWEALERQTKILREALEQQDEAPKQEEIIGPEVGSARDRRLSALAHYIDNMSARPADQWWLMLSIVNDLNEYWDEIKPKQEGI